MNAPLRVGLFLDATGPAIAPRREVWQVADEAGFDHLWHDDHLLTVAEGRSPDGPIHESWTLLGAMAEATKRVRVGVMVTSNMYRNPGMLAKMAATVDHISGGRLEVAMGAGWSDVELTSLGMPAPTGPRERVERLDESCAILKLLWTQVRTDFDGKYYRLVDAILEPKPVQKPQPRLWVGAEGKRMLRVTARRADVWNVVGSGDVEGVDADVEKSRLLDAYCLELGRDPADIARTVMLRLTSVDEICRLVERYVAGGFSEIILELQVDDPRRRVEQEAIPAMTRIRELVHAPASSST
jgi:alkanesulfonate monooxygenase SsuD/methylene tetrahydromethanopterin reductase-like flavin-dependent oxidoreductase (luciferase family)